MAHDPKDLLNHLVAEHAHIIHRKEAKLRKDGMVPSHIEEGELFSAGYEGLMHAIAHYNEDVAQASAKDPDKNHFAKYAGHWIKGKMMERLKSGDPIPLYYRRKASQLSQKSTVETPKEETSTPPEPSSNPEKQ
jgi:DNA-directed RNA polymerase specialized sigma subunit